MNAINREILRLAWPAIATNITTPILSLCDIAIVGHIENGNLIAAVAVGSTVFNIVYWMFAFLRMGTSGLTAIAYGSKDITAQRRVLFRGVCIASAAAFIILVAAPLVGPYVIGLVDDNTSANSDAVRYFSVAIWGAPGVLMTYVCSGWMLGMQQSKPIMWIALTTNLLNIALSVIFVFIAGLGIVGVGLGTALSQITGGVIGVIVVAHKLPRKLNGIETYQKVASTSWRSFFSLNRDIFLRTVCLAAVTLWFTHAGATMNQSILSANTILMQFFLVFSYFMDGFAFGGEALAGRFLGAQDLRNLQHTVSALFKWGIWTALIFSGLYFIAGDIFIRLLTDDLDIISLANDFSLWTLVIPLTGFSAFTWDGIFIGMTRYKYLLSSMAVAMIVFFGILYFTGFYNTSQPVQFRNHQLWLAFVCYLATRGVVAWLLYRRHRF